MLFSTATVAFAAEGDATETSTTAAAEENTSDNPLADMNTEDII
jgi:hypothetical protein